MIRNLSLFLATFVVGAFVALVARAALFDPHPVASPVLADRDHAPMVSNPLAPAPAEAMPAAANSSRDPHAEHSRRAEEAHANHQDAPPPAEKKAEKPVNTVCAICGMDVDPDLPTAQYQGKTIGFGCRMCPPKFKADPDRYGPYYLKNEVIER